jgi:anti-anti-sigma factor
MPLSFRSRIVGDITVVRCDGAIVEGAESAALRQHVNEALQHTLAIVLDLADVHFIDSGGLGLLIRILARTGQDRLKLCGLTSRVSETLRITRLATVFDCHETEAGAIAAFYADSVRSSEPSAFAAPNVLCVERSAELLTYVQEVLRQAGVRVMTANNLPDAVTLLKAMSPKVVVVGQELRSAGTTGTVEAFNRLLEALTVVELPADFARRDPGKTGPELVERVRVLIESGV